MPWWFGVRLEWSIVAGVGLDAIELGVKFGGLDGFVSILVVGSRLDDRGLSPLVEANLAARVAAVLFEFTSLRTTRSPDPGFPGVSC